MLRVRAVVMTRDDSSGGWVPTGGGGLSHVTVTRRREDGHRQYLIRGERLRDQAPMLECTLCRDLEYNEVTPTFHHWRVGGSRFGLTFQSPADASAFRRGVRGALQALAAGSPSSSSSSSAGDRGDTGDHSPALEQPPPSPPASPCAPHPEPPPVPPTIVTSKSSATGYRPPGGQPQPLPLGEAEELPQTPPPRRDLRDACGYEDYRRAGGASAAATGTPPARIRFQKDPKGSPSCRIHGEPPPGAPSRCVYCRGVFSREENGRGQCRDAPDPTGRCVRRLSCLWCAESLLYHCMADAEGDFSAPCSCGGGHPHCCARWLAPTALALLVPCLCCYPPPARLPLVRRPLRLLRRQAQGRMVRGTGRQHRRDGSARKHGGGTCQHGDSADGTRSCGTGVCRHKDSARTRGAGACQHGEADGARTHVTGACWHVDT